MPIEEPVTRGWLEKCFAAVAERINTRFDTTEQKVTKLLQRVAALEADMEQRGHKGVWQSGAIYKRHNAVTHDGSTWTCRAAQTEQRPGSGMDWILTTKRGRDGKDAAA